MKIKYVILWRVLCLAVGGVLVGLSFANVVDSFWSGMGSALIVVSLLNLIRIHRINKNEEYRERLEIDATDERNRFIRNKSWAFAGYLFIIISAVSVIVLKVLVQDLLSIATSCALCLMLILYWVSYLIFNKKY